MKKLITVLVIIVLLLSAGIAGALGYVWYRDNHIFVEDAVYPLDSTTLDLRGQDISLEHYESVRAQLPDCEILWDVPFQGAKYANDTTSLKITTLSDEDISRMDYFEKLTEVDASGCREYALLEKLAAHRPQCSIRYQVAIGATEWAPDTTELVLKTEDFAYDLLMENLKYLPNVTSITFKMSELSREQMDALAAAYEGVTVSCTVSLNGQEYDVETTTLDLSSLTSEGVPEVADKLSWLPGLETVELMNGEGTSSLTKEDVKLLQEAAPGAVFHYTFDFFGHTLSTTDTEVHIRNTRIGDAGVAEVRQALDIMKNCKRFVLEYCSISNEVMAQLRDDYRDQTKLVWRVHFGQGSTMTDAQIIRAVYKLVDDNCHDLVYCEDVRFIDFGHNEFLDTCDFVAGMPNLEYIILSGSPIRDLTPFANCKKLKLLEIAFCEYVTDLSPLAGCESLQMLNIGNTHVTDLSPLDDLPMTHLMARVYPSGKCRIPVEEQERFIAQHPDCWSSFTGAQPYGSGWRYGENENDPLEHYALMRKVFRYHLDPNIPNHVGWYLEEEYF